MEVSAQLDRSEFSSSHTIQSLRSAPKRNLGCLILLAAIEDYIGMDAQAHASAAQFLFPTDAAYHEHYEWVVSMAEGLNRAWLRDALDGAKPRWDKERQRERLKASLVRAASRRISA